MTNPQHYDKICMRCNGLIARPNTGYGYSGNFCQCEEPVISQNVSTISINHPQLPPKVEKRFEEILKKYLYKITTKGADWPLGRKAITKNTVDELKEILASELQAERERVINEVATIVQDCPYMSYARSGITMTQHKGEWIEKINILSNLKALTDFS